MLQWQFHKTNVFWCKCSPKNIFSRGESLHWIIGQWNTGCWTAFPAELSAIFFSPEVHFLSIVHLVQCIHKKIWTFKVWEKCKNGNCLSLLRPKKTVWTRLFFKASWKLFKKLMVLEGTGLMTEVSVFYHIRFLHRGNRVWESNFIWEENAYSTPKLVLI